MEVQQDGGPAGWRFSGVEVQQRWWPAPLPSRGSAASISLLIADKLKGSEAGGGGWRRIEALKVKIQPLI